MMHSDRERALEEAAKVAERFIGGTSPRYETGIKKGALPSMQADNCINAMKVRAQEIATAIRALIATPPAETGESAGGWRDIASAPKDGTTIDVWRDGSRETVYWGFPPHECGEMGSLCDSDWHRIKKPGWICSTFGEFVGGKHDPFTHWMPLPAAPGLPTPAAQEPGQVERVAEYIRSGDEPVAAVTDALVKGIGAWKLNDEQAIDDAIKECLERIASSAVSILSEKTEGEA